MGIKRQHVNAEALSIGQKMFNINPNSMQSKNWNKKSVIQFLKKNDSFESFMEGECAGIRYRLNNVDFLIFRNNTSIEFYYHSPYNPAIDYQIAESFFAICGPILCKMACDAADKRLVSKSGNVWKTI